MTHADYCDPPDIGFPARPTRVYDSRGQNGEGVSIRRVALVRKAPAITTHEMLDRLSKSRFVGMAEGVAARHGVDVHRMLGLGRRDGESAARRELYAAIYERLPNFEAIARLLGRSRNSICYGVDKHLNEQPRITRGAA